MKLKGHLLSIHTKQKPFYSVINDNQPVTAGRGRYVYYTVCLAYSVLYEVLVKKKSLYLCSEMCFYMIRLLGMVIIFLFLFIA